MKIRQNVFVPCWINFQWGHDEISFMVDQLSYKSVPAAIHNSSPGSIFHSFKSKVEWEIIGEFPQQINTETGAAFKYCWVWISDFFSSVDINWESKTLIHRSSKNENRLLKYKVFCINFLSKLFSIDIECFPSSESATIWQIVPLVAVQAVGWSSMM